MSDYIKRKDAIKILTGIKYDCAYHRDRLIQTDGEIDCYKALVARFKEAPTADVVPRELYERALSDVIRLSNVNAPFTNANRIRAMSDKELASWINDHADCNCRCEAWKDGCMVSDSTCMTAWLDWLKEEVK